MVGEIPVGVFSEIIGRISKKKITRAVTGGIPDKIPGVIPSS